MSSRTDFGLADRNLLIVMFESHTNLIFCNNNSFLPGDLNDPISCHCWSQEIEKKGFMNQPDCFWISYSQALSGRLLIVYSIFKVLFTVLVICLSQAKWTSLGDMWGQLSSSWGLGKTTCQWIAYCDLMGAFKFMYINIIPF